MFALLCFVLAVLVLPFKARSRLEAENAMLRHQLNVLRRKVRGRILLTNSDRWFFVQLCVPKTLSALISCRNHLPSVHNVCVALLRSGRPGLAIQVEEPA